MSMQVGQHGEGGFALIDALVGIALAGIVLLAASRGLSQLSQARQATLQATELRHQVETLAATMTRLLEAVRDMANGASPTGPPANSRAFSFAIADFSSGNGRVTPMMLLVSRDRRGLSNLSIRREGETDSASDILIAGATEIELSYVVETADGTAVIASEALDRSSLRALRIMISDRQTARTHLVAVPYPRFFRAICIAQPYLKECLG